MSHPASCIRSACSSEAEEGGGDAERSGWALGTVGACLGTGPGPHFGLPFGRLSAHPILTHPGSRSNTDSPLLEVRPRAQCV